MTEPRVSIVIRTLNEERWLAPLVTRLRSQTRAAEIVVVDSGSVDGTLDLARGLCDKAIEIHGDAFSYGHALNIGIAESTGDLVAILSAHTLPLDERWLEALSAPFSTGIAESGLALTYGRQCGNHLTKLSEHSDFARQYPTDSRRQKRGDHFCNNANSMIRRDLWTQRPFDQTLPGLEDIEWARYWMARGFDVQYRADAEILHIHEETWPQIYRRFRREALAARMIGLESSRPAGIVAAEAARLASDLVVAARHRSVRAVREAILYRYWKTAGTLGGLKAPIQSAHTPNAEGGATYRALEVRGENHAEMVDQPLPALKPNEVLIRVSYVGICQTDLEVLRLTLGYYKDGTARLPLVPGHEYSGVIVRKGANVETLRLGDSVVGECILSCGVCEDCLANRQTACRQRREVGVVNYNGACADYLVLPARFVHRLPPECPQLSACTVEPLAVVLKGFRRLRLMSAREAGRSRVLVIGAGAIGNLCSQVAAHLGHRVTAVDRLASRLKYLDGICEETTTSMPPLAKFQYVIEATGLLEMAELALTRTPTGCDVLLLGFPYGPFQWNAEQLVAQDKRAVGSVGSDYETFEAAIRMLPSLDLGPFNERVVDLQDWELAYRLHESKQHLKIKLQVRPPGVEPPNSMADGAVLATLLAP